MQSINNLRDNLRSSNISMKKLIIFGVVIIILVVLGILAISRSGSNNKDSTSSSGEYYDPASKETVSDTPGKTPEQFSEEVPQPVFLGFSNLLDYGISEDQLNGLKVAYIKYIKKSGVPGKEISIYVDTIESVPVERGSEENRKITFKTIIDREDTFSATIEYTGLTDIRLVLNENNKSKLVFDSGWVTLDVQSEVLELGD